MSRGSWRTSQTATQKSNLDTAWQDRMADAKALLASNRPAAAIACGLHAREIRLKVLVYKNHDLNYLPTPVQIHDPQELFVLAGLSQRIDQPHLKNVKYSWDQVVLRAGSLNDLRYKPDANIKLPDANHFLEWLDDPNDGVLPWLSTL